MGDYKNAMDLFDKSIEIKSDYEKAFIDKIRNFFIQKKYSDCITLSKEISRKFPRNVDIPWYIGDCYSYKNDYYNAIKYYDEALKLDPQNDSLIVSLGWEYYYLQDYKKSQEYVDDALKFNIESKDAEELKKYLSEAQKPENYRIAHFIKDNYLYLDKIKNANSLINTFESKGNININDIENFMNAFRYNKDQFTFLISGKHYDDYKIDDKINHIVIKTIDKDTKYIRIYSFTSDIANEFRDAVEKMKDNENKTLIIDLRDNFGGLVEPANDILDILLGECVTSYSIYRDGTIDSYNSDKNQIKFKRIIIFVNGNSASSSEMLSLGLKKYLNNVTIIGTPTLGKGVGQIVYEDRKKKYMLFLVDHYWNVKEKNIMGENIKPDIYVNGSNDADYFNEIAKTFK